MKRLRAGKEGEMKSAKIANLLLLLSCGVGKAEKINHQTKPLGRSFECKTCNRQFPSFQALGGHSTSHKRPRVQAKRIDQMQGVRSKPRVHECPVCGLEFPMGQALGGHMRRHKPTAEALSRSRSYLQERESAGKMLLDLNSPPSDDDLKPQNLWFGVGLLEEVPNIG